MEDVSPTESYINNRAHVGEISCLGGGLHSPSASSYLRQGESQAGGYVIGCVCVCVCVRACVSVGDVTQKLLHGSG